MITRNFYRKIKALSRVFRKVSAELERIHTRAFIPSIEMLKRRGEMRKFRHRTAREIPCERFGRFYRPTGLDMFKIDKLRIKRREALDAPFKYSASEEWAQLQEREREWYRHKAEEHFEKMQQKHREERQEQG